MAVVPSVFIFQPDAPAYQVIVSLVAVLIIFRHRSNMAKIFRGEENRFSFRGGKNG